VVLISLAGAGFGWMRQASGSTKAATIMHGTYNALEFVAFLAQTNLPQH
jgi:membrane protease YdiL (CAAX protease family)